MFSVRFYRCNFVHFINIQNRQRISVVCCSCNLEDLPTNGAMMANDAEFSVSSDLLISRPMLTELINEAAKLKGSTVTRELPVSKLNKLMNVLHWNVRDGAKLIPIMDQVC